MYPIKYLILFLLIIPILLLFGMTISLFNLHVQAIEIITPSNNTCCKITVKGEGNS